MQSRVNNIINENKCWKHGIINPRIIIFQTKEICVWMIELYAVLPALVSVTIAITRDCIPG